MRVVGKILLWVLLVLVLIGGIVGGVVAWSYHNTDAEAFTAPTVMAGDTALGLNGYQWSEPVMGGLLYKDAQENATLQMEDLGIWDADSMNIQIGSGDPSHLVVKDQAGSVILDANNQREATVQFPANGQYTLEVRITIPEKRASDAPSDAAHGYGLFRYAARVNVDVPPEIKISETKVEQGAVITVLVKGFLDGLEPQIETGLSLAQFCDVPGGKAAFIGVHYNREPGEYPLHVSCGSAVLDETIQVVHRDFPKQYMTISSSVANATMNSAAANEEWRNTIYPIYEAADPTIYWEGTFVRPCEATAKNSEYGLFRYTNGATTPVRHAGIDYDCDQGDEVWSPARGKVVYAGFLQMTGNTVVVEHGGGLKSYFFHMDSLACETGQMVEQGQLVGLVGSTGYSTGPHLHYEARIGNQSVDPEQLFNGTSGLYFVR